MFGIFPVKQQGGAAAQDVPDAGPVVLAPEIGFVEGITLPPGERLPLHPREDLHENQLDGGAPAGHILDAVMSMNSTQRDRGQAIPGCQAEEGGELHDEQGVLGKAQRGKLNPREHLASHGERINRKMTLAPQRTHIEKQFVGMHIGFDSRQGRRVIIGRFPPLLTCWRVKMHAQGIVHPIYGGL